MKIKRKVERILSESVASRNSDTELMIQYLEKFVCENQDEQDCIRKVLQRAKINLAWITRIRAYFQNTEGLYLSDEQVRKAREALEPEYKEEYSPINNWTRY